MRALRSAAWLAGGYLVVAGAWIAVSDRVVVATATTVREASLMELAKGIGFVLVTGTLLFFGAWALLRDAERRQQELGRRRELLLRLERKALLGSFCGSLAHEFRNLLTVVASAVDVLTQGDGRGGPPREVLDDLERSLDRGLELTRQMADVDAGRLDAVQVVDLTDIARSALESVSWHLMVKRTTHEVQADGPVPARVRPEVLRHALAHLVLNAGEHTDGRGRIEVRLGQSDGRAVIEIHDDGWAVPAAKDDAAEGLGLVFAEQAAEAHRGRLTVTRSDLGGACVRVELPLGPPEQWTPAARGGNGHRADGGPGRSKARRGRQGDMRP